MAQMSYKMFNQNFQQAYYGMNAANAFFSNATAVVSQVLVNITDTDQRTAIYTDTEYGMYAGKPLAIWVAAHFENAGLFWGWTTSPKQLLINHFALQNITLTDELISQIVGPGSELATIIATLET